MAHSLDELIDSWTQRLEKLEAQRFDELSEAELVQAFHSYEELTAELDGVSAKVRAVLDRRAVRTAQLTDVVPPAQVGQLAPGEAETTALDQGFPWRNR